MVNKWIKTYIHTRSVADFSDITKEEVKYLKKTNNPNFDGLSTTIKFVISNQHHPDIKNILNINPAIIKLIDKPTLEQQEIAVGKYGWAIKYINNPSPYIQRLSLFGTNGGYLGWVIYIKNLDPEVQLELLERKPDAWYNIRNPSEEVQLMAVKKNGISIRNFYEKGIEPSENVKKAAVTNIPSAITYIKKPSYDIQMFVAKKGITYLNYIEKEDINPLVIQHLIEEDFHVIYHLERYDIPISEELILKTLRREPETIRLLEKQTIERQMAVLEGNIYNISMIKKPFIEVQLYVINISPKAINLINNPSPEVIEIAKKKG